VAVHAAGKLLDGLPITLEPGKELRMILEAAGDR
jgi:hypothetical protein